MLKGRKWQAVLTFSSPSSKRLKKKLDVCYLHRGSLCTFPKWEPINAYWLCNWQFSLALWRIFFFLFHNKLFFSTQYDSNEKQSCSLLFLKTFMINGLEHVSVEQWRLALVKRICWQESESQMKNRGYQRPVVEPDLRVNDTSNKINPAKTNTEQATTVLVNSVSFFKVLFFVVIVKLI